MDQNLINLIMGGFGALLGFFMKSIYDSVKELQKADKDLAEKVSSIEVLVAGKYVTRDELVNSMKVISAQLDRIEHRLEAKADK